MKKLFALLAALIFAFSLNISAQDLDEILESHFDAIGQKKALEHQTFVLKGKVVQMGMEFPMTLYQKRPGKARMEAEIQGTKIIQAFDGEKGWSVIPFTGSMEPQDMGEEEVKSLKQMGDIDGDLYDWKAKGSELTLVGSEDMEGTAVFKLKRIKSDGDEFYYYIDAENYVILRTDAKVMVNGSPVESSSFYSNFKPVGGMVMPYAIESRMNDQVVAQIVFESIELDTEVDDSLFAKPVSGN